MFQLHIACRKKSTATACIVFIPRNRAAAVLVLETRSPQKLKQMKENTKDSCKNACEEAMSEEVRRDKSSFLIFFFLKCFEDQRFM